MYAARFTAAAFAAFLLVPGIQAGSAQAQTASPDQDNRLRWLDPVTFAPANAFAPPPAPGSDVERLEFERLRTLIAGASAERLKRAAWDGDHEDPAAFSEAAGRDLAQFPATASLLAAISGEVDRTVHAAKAYFKRPRPYQMDPSLPHCGKGSTAPTGYPSGHSGYGWSVGWTLARLIPERAPAILARAQDYALSREICGVHFISDLEASRGAATAAAEQLLADPRLASQLAAARAELAAR